MTIDRRTRRESEIIKTNETVRDDERVALANDPGRVASIIAHSLAKIAEL